MHVATKHMSNVRHHCAGRPFMTSAKCSDFTQSPLLASLTLCAFPVPPPSPVWMSLMDALSAPAACVREKVRNHIYFESF